MRNIMACAVGLVLAGTLTAHARDEVKSAGLKDKDIEVLTEAPAVLQALATAPDKGISQDLLEKAECVVVFPDVAKGAFVVGGEFGRGVATCREAPGGAMGSPVMFTIGGASIGWQVGGESTDYVLLVMDKNGMDNLLRSEFKIGADASVAAGPVGRNAEASTDVLLGAQMLSWSRSKGVFAGASLEGAVVKVNDEANARLYGREITAKEILENNPSMPPESRSFVTLASRLTSGDEPSAYSEGTGTHTAQGDSRTYSNADLDSAAVTGTVVSVSPNRLSVDTASGRRTFTLNESTNQPNDLRAGQRVSITHNDALVATNITRSGDYDAQLPRTASYLPLIGLAGVLLLLAAYRMNFRSRHAS